MVKEETMSRPIDKLVEERLEDLDVYHGVRRTWFCDDEPALTQMVIAEVLVDQTIYEVYVDDEGRVLHRPIVLLWWEEGLPPGVHVEWTTPLT
jgi:hypothetical protein